MKTINANTIKGQNFIKAYKCSTTTELWEAYGSYSTDKAVADRNCRKRMSEEGGEGYRIISACRFFFTCAWQVAEGLRVETAKGSYLVK